jgi:hypothetical protein
MSIAECGADDYTCPLLQVDEKIFYDFVSTRMALFYVSLHTLARKHKHVKASYHEDRCARTKEVSRMSYTAHCNVNVARMKADLLIHLTEKNICGRPLSIRK